MLVVNDVSYGTDKLKIENYCPITLIPIFCKIFVKNNAIKINI